MPVVGHVLELAQPLAQQLRDSADVLLDGIHHQVLDRLVGLAVDFAGDYLGTRHGELVSLAAQRFDQDRQVQLTPTRNQELVGAVGVLDAQTDVGLELAQQPRA